MESFFISDLSEGKTLEVNKGKFEILRVLEEVDVDENGIIGEHIEVELRNKESKSLRHTHLLRWYPKDDFIYLYDVLQSNRGNSLEFTNERKVFLKDIKIL